MGFTKIVGFTSRQNPEGRPGSLIRTVAIDAEKMKLVNEIIATYNGETLITNKQGDTACQTLRGMKYWPYWICKNKAIQVKGQRGMYDLSRFKLSAEAQRAIEAAAAPEVAPVVTEPTPEVAPVAPAKPKREKRAKAEGANPKREKRLKIETPEPVVTEPEAVATETTPEAVTE